MQEVFVTKKELEVARWVDEAGRTVDPDSVVAGDSTIYRLLFKPVGYVGDARMDLGVEVVGGNRGTTQQFAIGTRFPVEMRFFQTAEWMHLGD